RSLDCCGPAAILRCSAAHRIHCPYSLHSRWSYRPCARYSVVCVADAYSPPTVRLSEPCNPQVSALSVHACTGTLSVHCLKALCFLFSDCFLVLALFVGYFCSRFSMHAVSFRIRPPATSPAPLWFRSARCNHNEFDPGGSLLADLFWGAWSPITLAKTST